MESRRSGFFSLLCHKILDGPWANYSVPMTYFPIFKMGIIIIPFFHCSLVLPIFYHKWCLAICRYCALCNDLIWCPLGPTKNK